MNPEYGVAAKHIKYDFRCINSHAVSNQQVNGPLALDLWMQFWHHVLITLIAISRR